jgi:hypothetical protein
MPLIARRPHRKPREERGHREERGDAAIQKYSVNQNPGLLRRARNGGSADLVGASPI